MLFGSPVRLPLQRFVDCDSNRMVGFRRGMIPSRGQVIPCLKVARCVDGDRREQKSKKRKFRPSW